MPLLSTSVTVAAQLLPARVVMVRMSPTLTSAEGRAPQDPSSSLAGLAAIVCVCISIGNALPGPRCKPLCSLRAAIVVSAYTPSCRTVVFLDTSPVSAYRRPMKTSCNNVGKGHYVYIGAKGNQVKIGTSGNPDDRMRAQGLAGILVIHGSFSAEKMVHELFAADRQAGEWFAMSTQIMLFVATGLVADVCYSCAHGAVGGGDLKDALNATTRVMILDAIGSTGNNNSQIARDLGISRSNLIGIRKRLGIGHDTRRD